MFILQFLHPGLSTKKILLTKTGVCKLYDFCLAEDATGIILSKKSKVLISTHSKQHVATNKWMKCNWFYQGHSTIFFCCTKWLHFSYLLASQSYYTNVNKNHQLVTFDTFQLLLTSYLTKHTPHFQNLFEIILTFSTKQKTYLADHFPPETTLRNEYTPESDVWALAVVILEIVTGGK